MIRKARVSDVPSIQSLINDNAESGQMLPRTLNELYEHLRDFTVLEDNSSVIGVCALHISWEGLAEIRSLAVHKDRMNKGIGSALVRACLSEARDLGAARVFVLTYKNDFFKKFDFADVDKKELPHKVWSDCLNCIKFPNCDESALMLTLSPS